ncbi:transferrin-binding protein-like solute binding protein [Sphingomonas arenae]|uniref:transferrin-binding protein-like solute binding protein n=1 Tax=Sphingomonas arenae TaxID=2812555 RepID=UPI0019689C33|nr:transferrin-binding protein-like solute binding protein [Sphingomonas arenae]
MGIRVLGRLAGVTTLALSVAACGGGGGGAGLVNTPPPPPPPPPPAAAVISIFADPVANEYASVGASIAGPGGNLDTYDTTDVSFTPVSSASADQPRIRYTGTSYEIEMPGDSWDKLVPYGGLSNPGPDNNYFEPDSINSNEGFLVTSNSRTRGYTHVELGSWGSQAAGRWGYVAFGTPTPGSDIPVTGSATFSGSIMGSSDVLVPDFFYGGYVPLPVSGSIDFTFDFGRSSLSGSLSPILSTPNGDQSLGTFAFSDTVYSAGSTTFSGRFDTPLTGDNFFLGRFFGPDAKEAGGAWALPFQYDGSSHQAFGGFIAKRN